MKRNHRNIGNILIGIAILALSNALLPAGVFAQACEYPLPIQRNIPDGNVIFVLDSSNSMNSAVFHDDYDPFTVYAGLFDPATEYTASKDGTYSPWDFDKAWPKTPTAYLVKSDASMGGIYGGNYLNWIYFVATDAQRASLPAITRIQASKQVIIEMYDENPQIRFGVFKFHAGGTGGTLIAKVGSPRNNFTNQTNGVQAKGPGATAETLVDVKTYFEQQGNLAPIEYSCQKSFLVILTDGYPTEDMDVPGYIGDWDGDGNEPGTCTSIGSPDDDSQNCSDYMDDVAGYLFEHDLRPDLDGTQNLITYVVGYYVDAPLLRETAANGDGLFFNATNLDELHVALRNVLRDIIQRISAGSAIAVVSTEDRTNDRLYRTKYLPVKWHGFVESFALPYTSGDSPVWEAGSLLASRNPASRNIFTSLNNVPLPFTTANADKLFGPMGMISDLAAAPVIDWARGADVFGLRDRQGWVLGDVVDSSPVVIGRPAIFSLDPDYSVFKSAYDSRAEMVYFGANDCMLHALYAETGEEAWAYVPQSQLFRLKSLADSTYCHEYSVNQTPRVTDLKIGGQWMTVLVGATRQGGNTYFAINISDPNTPVLLWEADIPNLRGSWATPAFAHVPWNNEPVMIVGMGYDTVNGFSGVVILDMSDGSVAWSDVLDVKAGPNKTSSATVVDFDLDGMHDVAYMNTLAGNTWRVDLTTFPPSPSTLYAGSQPLQSRPILTVDFNNDVFVYFGSGQYLEVADFTDLSPQTYYCVYDNHSGATVTRTDMIDQTSTISPIGANDRGWFVDLVQDQGERIIEPSALVAGVVYATSFRPAVDLCSFGGFSWLYNFKFRNGAAHDDDEDVSNDNIDDRVEEIGDGIASKPVIDIANEDVIIQGSDTEIHVKDAKGIITLMVVRSWRQRY